jgi:DNA-directed RNA polymerase specialized sigma24 family protein
VQLRQNSCYDFRQLVGGKLQVAPDAEQACLEALIAGRDAWPEFWRMYGRLILWELRVLGITAPEEQQDLYHDLVLKLLDHDCRVLRDYLAAPQQDSFRALLRVITRHQGISRLRRPSRSRELPLLDAIAPPAAAQDTAAEWAGDPAQRYEAEQLLKALLKQAAGGAENSEGYRIMHLRFCLQLSVNLIAAQMKLKPNAVTQRIRHYLKRLRLEYGIALREHGDG